jgi:hypothetical protein
VSMSINHKLSKYAGVLVGIAFLNGCGQSPAQNQTQSDPVPYEILKDDMSAKILVGVSPDITEPQLRATLTKAADEHQSDAARDYLFSDRLWVDAYLVKEKPQSLIPAGTLRRYVPPRNPNVKGDDTTEDKEDKFFIKLEEARRTLRMNQNTDGPKL